MKTVLCLIALLLPALASAKINPRHPVESLSLLLALPHLGGNLATAQERIQNIETTTRGGHSEVTFTVAYPSHRDLNSGCDDQDCEPHWQEVTCSGAITVSSDLSRASAVANSILCR